jgi:purine catabolism regulator
MRARLPAFDSVHGGELALLTLPQLRRLDETLPHLLQSLQQEGVAAVAVGAASLEALGQEACAIADQLHLPLILLPLSAPLEEIEREVITFVVSFRGEIERKASEVSRRLMQLSIQGAGIQGVCEELARSCGKLVVVQDAEQQTLFVVPVPGSEQPALPEPLSNEQLWQHGLTRIVAPILIRHEVVGSLSLVGKDGDFDYLERIILGQVAPILAIEFARARERSEVESRYQAEAFMDVVQGSYQQPEEMLARARLLGYDLTLPHVVVMFELSPNEPDYATGSLKAQWGKRLREELLRGWPTGWILVETRRVTALLPATNGEYAAGESHERDREDALFARVERVYNRVRSSSGGRNSGAARLPVFSGGIGRIAADLQGIPDAYREAQRALEIGRRLFGEEKLHSFARLGIYRLLFYLDGQEELNNFYQETLGPLLQADTRGDGMLIETLEGYFRCNGNLSETARTMHFHRNSLLYRLGRIEEILGRSLEDPELRLSLQIALKIHHLQKH